MRKVIVDGYILCVVDNGNELTKNEHHAIMEAIKNKPIAPKGYMYKLKDTLEWELCRTEQSGGM